MEPGGLVLGVCIAERAFTCLLCRQHFSRVCSDLILPETQVCDACLAALGPRDEVALRTEITRRVGEREAAASNPNDAA